MSRAGVALGFCGLTALVAALPVGLKAAPRGQELRVDLPTERAYVDRSAAGGLPVDVGPPDLLPRITTSVPFASESLELRSWRVEYGGGRWVREVTLPVIAPLPSSTTTCGIHLDIGLGLFEANGPESPLGNFFVREINRVLPPTAPHKYLERPIVIPRASTTSLDVIVRSATSAHLVLRIGFHDGSWAQILQSVQVATRLSAPSLSPDAQPVVRWGGPLREQVRTAAGRDGKVLVKMLAFALPGIVADISGSKADGIVDEKTAAAVGPLFATINRHLARLTESRSPDDGSSARWRVFLSDTPTFGSESLRLPICITDAADLPSRPLGQAPPALRELGRSHVRAHANPAALNGLARLAWRAGILGELGRSPDLLDALPDYVQDLAFTVTGFEPGLPPVVTQGPGDELDVAVADVQLGTWEARRVVAHATGRLLVESRDGAIGVDVRPTFVTVNCTAQQGGRVRLEPCLSELLPTIQEKVMARPSAKSWPATDFLEALPTVGFGGLRLELQDLQAKTSSTPPGLTVTGRAELAKDLP